MIQCISQPGVLPISPSLALLPLYVLALLKSQAFSARYMNSSYWKHSTHRTLYSSFLNPKLSQLCISIVHIGNTELCVLTY